MPHHEWGDKDFDWDSLGKAISTGTFIMSKLGRIGVHSKEKYGTARWTIMLCDGSLHSITHPGYVYSQYPKWLWSFDVRVKPLKWIKPYIQLCQKVLVKLTFIYLCKKYPHIIDEIICDAPSELLSHDLKMRSRKMWTTYCKKCSKQFTCDNEKCPECGFIYNN